jgi:hypothetical protein
LEAREKVESFDALLGYEWELGTTEHTPNSVKISGITPNLATLTRIFRVYSVLQKEAKTQSGDFNEIPVGVIGLALIDSWLEHYSHLLKLPRQLQPRWRRAHFSGGPE